MNDILKCTGMFAIGAAAGVLCTKEYFRKKHKEELNKEIEDIKDYYFDKYHGVPKESEPVVRAEDVYISEDKRQEYDTTSEWTEEVKPVVADISVENYPFVIDYNEFSMDEDDYEVSSLEYYVLDDSLVDDGEEVRFVDEMVGEENLENFSNNANIETLYIKNPELGIKFEISKIDERFVDCDEDL